VSIALAGALALPAVGAAASPSPGATTPEPPVASFAAEGLTLRAEPFAEGLASPVFVTGDRSGTGWLYALEQDGRIMAIAPDGTLATVPVLDIRDRVTAGGEQGLLGLALHPDFRQNGRLFLNYTRRDDGATTISEFTVRDDGIADPDSERVILVIPQPYGNHNGGMIAFDAGGMLLIGMGDGGSGGDPQGYGQDREALLGKMLRIDVDGANPYAIPADNPFLDEAGVRPEIWAIGLRNPWRFSIDRETGDLWIGDVGQGALEEVSVVPAGAGGLNLGWNVMEGDACYDASECDRTGLLLPVATIAHADGACSVIGGYVYRGDAFPDLRGAYAYTDLCTGELVILDAAEAVATGRSDARIVGSTDGSIVSFGEGDDGELYLVDQGGRVLRVVAEPAQPE
jgi:glucose/arabinose dehydrogenase